MKEIRKTSQFKKDYKRFKNGKEGRDDFRKTAQRAVTSFLSERGFCPL